MSKAHSVRGTHIMSHKFSGNVLAECAYVIASHGFPQGEYGTSNDGDTWHALVYVSGVILMNAGEDELLERLDFSEPDISAYGAYVHITEDTYGFVDVVDYGLGDDNGQAVINRYEAAEAEYDSDTEGEY